MISMNGAVNEHNLKTYNISCLSNSLCPSQFSINIINLLNLFKQRKVIDKDNDKSSHDDVKSFLNIKLVFNNHN